MSKKYVLHVGCGPKNPEALHPAFKQPQWQEVRLDINPAVQPDIVGSITDMRAVANESVDAIWSCHNLEHLFAHEVPIALGEFYRVLKPNGLVLIRLPDIQAVAREVGRGNLENVLYESPAGPISSIDVIWGHRLTIANGNHFMAHKTGFTRETLQKKMRHAGFCGVQIECQGLDLMATGYKNDTSSRQLPALEKSETNSEIAKYYCTLGDDLQNKGKLEDSIASYQKALRVNPELAEAWYNMGNSLHGLGDFEKAISCFQKALKIRPDLVEVHYNLGNTYLDLKKYVPAVSSYQKALALKPDYMDAHYNMGISFFEQGLLDEALSSYQKAVELNPNRFETWYNMAIIFQQQNNLDRTIDCYQKAADLKPDFAQAYNNMAIAFKKQDNWREAISYYQKALKLKPDYADAWYNLGSTLHGLGNHRRAEACYQNALDIQPDYFKACNNLAKLNQDTLQIENALKWYKKSIALKADYAEAHFNLSTAYLLAGNFTAGWREYEWRFKRREWKKTYPYGFEIPRWCGQSLTGKRLYVHSEQGLGDILQFVRYLPMVKARGGTVIFETIKPMMRLFKGLAGVDELIEVSQRALADRSDYYIPLLSLPGIFQTRLGSIPADVPYLFADESKADQWKSRLADTGFKVGLVWAGTITDPRRSIPLARFRQICQISGLRLYGLQKGISAEQIEVEGVPEGMEITNFGQEFEDFADTAAVIDNLDLIISIDTSVAHLAGAMGKPVWLLLPFVPDWRWLLDREDSPWYPTIRLFRQQSPGDWDAPINQIFIELRRLSRTAPGKKQDDDC
ncbi:MAG: tetratricopeptide repeat protein [Desulfobacterales bacterium]|nr:MAG: tetratricopeptide repeat protein [Desulfobacterales bacterium]